MKWSAWNFTKAGVPTKFTIDHFVEVINLRLVGNKEEGHSWHAVILNRDYRLDALPEQPEEAKAEALFIARCEYLNLVEHLKGKIE